MKNLAFLKSRKKIEGLQYTKNSNKLLSFSLAWMGLGIMVIVSITAIMIAFPSIYLTIAENTFVWVITMILEFITLFALSITVYKKTDLSIVITLFLLFAICTGIFTGVILASFVNISIMTNNLMLNVMLILLVPGGIFIIMGLLGYLKVFNFSKIYPFLIISTISLMVVGLVMWFITSDVMITIYSILAIIIFSLWIGYDFWMIRRTNEAMSKVEDFTNKDYLRYSILFGAMLLIDFIQIVLSLTMLLSSLSR